MVTMELAKRTTMGPSFFTVSAAVETSTFSEGAELELRDAKFGLDRAPVERRPVDVQAAFGGTGEAGRLAGGLTQPRRQAARSTLPKVMVAVPGRSPSSRHSPSPFTADPATVDSRCARSDCPCEIGGQVRVAQRLSVQLHTLGRRYRRAVRGSGTSLWPAAAIRRRRRPSPAACPAYRGAPVRACGCADSAIALVLTWKRTRPVSKWSGACCRVPLNRTCLAPATSCPLVNLQRVGAVGGVRREAVERFVAKPALEHFDVGLGMRDWPPCR